MATSFEPKEAAKNRKEKLDCQPAVKKSKKDHIGKLEEMTWDKDALLAEVKSYEDGRSVSWRALANKYKVCNSKGQLANNGGQIVKQFVISQGIEINNFKPVCQRSGKQEVVRRKKRKVSGGEISMPTDCPPAKLRKMLIENLNSGEYTIGEMIVPKKVIIK